MKNLITLSLLLLFFVGNIEIASASTCNFFLDSTTDECVQKCLYPLVGDTNTKACLPNDGYCKQFYIQEQNVCVNSCPKFYKAQSVSGKSYQLCIPCIFSDAQGNCYEVCPPGLISDLINYKCLSSPQDCKAAYTKDMQICANDCPNNYIVDKTAKNPNICVSCKLYGFCFNSNNQNTNLNNLLSANCQLYVGADMQTCTAKCPPRQIALPQVKTQSYIQCQVCPSSTPYVSYDGTQCLAKCSSGQLIDQKSFNCIQPSQCTTNSYTDDQNNLWCVDKCPSPLQPVTVTNQSYSTCQPCSKGQYINLFDRKCVSSCDMVDETGKICLPNINYCKSCISQSLTKCSYECDPGLFMSQGNFEGQYYCFDKCKPSQFILQKTSSTNKVQSFCVVQCPQYFYPGANNICTPVEKCSNYLSMDGKTCFTSCPAGQLPQTVPNKKIQVCMPCLQMLSSDGKSCNASCAAGELYDIQKKQCIIQSQCNVLQSNGYCLPKCFSGYLLSVDSSNNKSCIPISSCTNYISSSRLSCDTSCGSNEGYIVKNNQKVCIFCPLGLASDKKTCLTSCQSGYIFDTVAQSCVNSTNCSHIVSADGNRCVAACEYPEVKPSSTATQCAYQCSSGQLYQDGVGCIDPSSCTGFQSANGKFCVQSCSSLRQIIGNNSSTPKTCQNCPNGQYPQVQLDKSILCIDKDSDPISSIKNQLSSILTPSSGSSTFTPTQTDTAKTLLKSITSDLESSITQAQSNSSITADKLQQIVQNGVSNLKTSIFNFLKQVQTYDASTNIDHDANKVQDQNQIILGSSTVQIIAEKQKPGYAFKLKFNLKDLIASSSISLQQDSSQAPTFASTQPSTTNSVTSSNLGIGDATGQTDSNISAMQITYLASNPNCPGCSTGLTTIDIELSGKLRNLQSSSDQTFQLTYNVDPSQIQKTICVSYDSNNSMTINPTSIDTANNQITCTFTGNSSLYYDSTCEYVSKTLCNSSNPNNSSQSFDASTTVISSKLLSLSAALAIAFFAFI
ncbi:hypothetical protein ABPG74_010212 [Tetrahymena malaccensis]